MKVRELMNSPAYLCHPQDSLAKAAQLMWDHDCGMLPVVDGSGRVGAAITDRDICMGALTRGRSLGELRVAESMSRDIVTCRPDDDVAVAAQRMAERRVHRLPVVDEHGKPCGVIALNDIALAAEQEPAIGREAMKILVSACEHRTAVPAPAIAAKPAAPAAPATPAVPPKPKAVGTRS